MSDPRSSLPPVIPGALSQIAAKAEQAVRIEAVRGGTIGDPARATRVEGEVIRVSKDVRTATIRTESGNEVDISLRGRVTLEEGQKVELELPPGRPPQQATLRPAQAVSQPSVPTPHNPAPAPAPAASDGTERPAPIFTQVTLPPELREAIDIADRLTAPASRDFMPLPPEAIVRLTPLLSGLPPLLPEPPPDLVTMPLPEAAFKRAAMIQPASATPQTSPGVQPLPTLPIPLQSAMTFPAELIRVEMPTLGGEISILPPRIQAALQDIKTLLHSDLFQSRESLSFIQPLYAKTSAIPPVTELQGDIKSLAAIIRAPSAFLTTLTTPPFAEPLRFDAAVAHIRPDAAIRIVADDGSIAEPPSPLSSVHPAQGVIAARVVAISAQNFPVLSVFLPGRETPDLFMMHFPASNLPAGTELYLIPQAPLPAAVHSMMQAALATPAFDLMTGWTWPVFEDAGSFLLQSGQPDAAKALANILPNAAHARQMPPAIMFMMAAVQAGDLAGWLGEKNIQLLRREGGKGPDILARLTRDFAGLSRMAQEPAVQDWRGMAIPMLWQNDIQKIHLYYRHQHGGEDTDEDTPHERSTRFIFDLHLTRLGEIQLDGLMKARRLDLILRTRTPLSDPMQAAMRAKYFNVLETGGLAGDLAFQNHVDQWVTVEPRREGWASSA